MVKRIDHTQLIRIINLGRYLMNTKEKKPKAESNKELANEIIELDSRFSFNALMRLNKASLNLIKDNLLKLLKV